MTAPTEDEDAGMKGSLNESAHERATRVSLSSEAAEWFVRLRDDSLGMRHRERNVRWLKQSPAHIAELLRIQQVNGSRQSVSNSASFDALSCTSP